MDPTRVAEQVVAIESARAYVAEIRPIDLANAGTLAGHLMAAETLLMQIAAAFEPAA
ncbi:hypothetical protein OH809_45200 (plasmid) [Streptomyces sp. NBC_00873]|uniref:hypothetical protein n=1 Tax=unclassified Streptomyces TaxID=2593676 RepID=UPI002F90B7CC|nr:hypothetical protein OH809_45200 [Streptomyces sp. NBC_00873]WTA49331.1 hypothetical protein OH821_45230 [Streptomyces sp. NBC_00842]